MKNQLQIRERIEELNESLDLINVAIEKEMEKTYDVRNYRLLDFLYKENAMYSFALSELQEIIKI